MKKILAFLFILVLSLGAINAIRVDIEFPKNQISFPAGAPIHLKQLLMTTLENL